MVISFLFGGHMAYLFTKIRYIGAGFIMHAYCKFMGIPNIIALLRMDTQEDLIAKSMNYHFQYSLHNLNNAFENDKKHRNNDVLCWRNCWISN